VINHVANDRGKELLNEFLQRDLIVIYIEYQEAVRKMVSPIEGNFEVTLTL
jgi:hypothetical protein